MPRLPAPLLRAGLLVAFALLAVGCARAGGEAFQPTHNTAITLHGEGVLGQTFSPATEAVRRVDLLVATYGVRGPEGELEVVLRDGRDGTVLSETLVDGDRLADNIWVPVRFDQPVPAPRTVGLEARWTGEEPIALRANIPPGEVGEDRLLNDPYPGGELLRDGERAAGDLAFRVVGAGGTGPTVGAATSMVRDAGAGLVQRPVFAVVWILLLAGCCVLAVTGLRRRS